MSAYQCPFCGITMPLIYDTYSEISAYFGSDRLNHSDPNYSFIIAFFRCPSCKSISSVAHGTGRVTKDIKIPLYPSSNAIQFPEYVPQQIREDYEEACSIVNLSPKASATLSRRCLQGMIHDYWNVHEKNLNAEITSLRDKIPADQWRALDAVRKLGNIGAHMEHDINTIVDIDPGEAERILRLIELLIRDWYIARHESEALLADITALGSEKDILRKGNP